MRQAIKRSFPVTNEAGETIIMLEIQQFDELPADPVEAASPYMRFVPGALFLQTQAGDAVNHIAQGKYEIVSIFGNKPLTTADPAAP